ncbi:hypothetical protein BD626DRAFT_633827, partial [Schizophyllum amplum]
MQRDSGSVTLKTSVQVEEEDISPQAKASSVDADDDALRAACDPVASQIAVNRSITAPEQRLPPELLAEIFLHLQKRPSSMLELIELDRIIARVCTTWRHVVLGTPRLWSSINVHAQSDTVDAEKCLRRYLPLSRSCPLYILCNTAGQPGLLPLLSEHASRWQHINLQISSAESRAMTPVATPLLERAQVHVRDALDAEHPGLLRFLQYTPRLRVLAFKGQSKEMAAKLSLPMSPVLVVLHLVLIDLLTSYSLTSVLPTIQQYRKTLKTLTCGLGGAGPAASESTQSAADERIQFPALLWLAVFGAGLELFPRISTPKLLMLLVDTGPAIFPSVFLDFLEREPLNIRVLQLLYNCRACSETDITMLLR